MELQISRYCETKWDKESWKENNSHIPPNEKFHAVSRDVGDMTIGIDIRLQVSTELSGLWRKLVGPSWHFMISFGSFKWNRNQTIHLSCGMREELMLFLHPYTRKSGVFQSPAKRSCGTIFRALLSEMNVTKIWRRISHTSVSGFTKMVTSGDCVVGW